MLLNLSLLGSDPVAFLRQLLELSAALIIAITVHEFSHAWMAYRLGDDTAKLQGRLSLNPLVHLDAMGTLLLFLVGFGWGKPVPVNHLRLRGGIRTGMAKVALAGPLSGLLAAGVLGLGLRLTGLPLNNILWLIFLYNIILALFNLIPLAPLDGFNVLQGLLPSRMAYSFSRLEAYGPGLLLLLIFVDYVTPLGILSWLFNPGINLMSQLFLGVRLI